MKQVKKICLLIFITVLFLTSSVFAKTGKVYNTSQGLVLRGSASKSGEPLATIADGTEVEILEENGDWYKVNVNQKEGYLFAEYVKVEEENEEEVLTESTNLEQKEVTSETKIHLLPVITSTIMGVVPVDGQVDIEKTVGNWELIKYENITGWIRVASSNVSETTEPEVIEEQSKEQESEEATEQEEPADEVANTQEDLNVPFRKGYINSSSVNMRKEPSTSSEILTTLILNTGVSITAQTEEWYRVVYGDYMGYIHKSLISENPIATSRSSETRSGTSEESNQEDTNVGEEPTVIASSAAGESVVSFAKQYLGYSYVYGGTTPSGFDCSGFVYYVFNSCGYSLSRSCSVQAQSGTAVSRDNLQPGDLLFFNNDPDGSIGHVGIYIGDGMMIHAANPRRGVVTDTIRSGYYNTYYYSARRIAN